MMGFFVNVSIQGRKSSLALIIGTETTSQDVAIRHDLPHKILKT